MATFTREQIDAITIGTKITRGIDDRWSEPRPVVSIHAKQNDIHGKLFVCGYTTYGEGAQLSFSIKEGDESDARHYRIG